MRTLVDTNAYSEMLRGHRGVADYLRRSEAVFVSAIVVGELLFGFRRGSRFETNASILERFLAKSFVHFLPVGRTTADRFSRIAAELKNNGTPIPTNDIWIGAHAMETGADLLSFDRHFECISGLAWVVPPE